MESGSVVKRQRCYDLFWDDCRLKYEGMPMNSEYNCRNDDELCKYVGCNTLKNA